MLLSFLKLGMGFLIRQGGIVDIWERLVDLEKKSEDFGLAWPNSLEIIQQIESECREIREHLEQKNFDKAALSSEIGDLMHAVMSLSWFCGFDSKKVLVESCNKFEGRLNMMKKLAQAEGLPNLKGQDFNVLMRYWARAKALLAHPQR